MWYHNLRTDYPEEGVMPVLYCTGKGKKCLRTYIQTREGQPRLCLHCLDHYGISNKFKEIYKK